MVKLDDDLIIFLSKTKYEEILAKAEKKQILDSVDDDEESSESVNAYKQYMTEVISAMVFYDNPTMDLEKHLPNMKIAAESILKISKKFYEVCILVQKLIDVIYCIRN